ncbi:type II toxin-antitoxin system RelE/ParE family toxin [Desulfobacterales bacterium HSG17]|nr:type II toxin-antitoxin system RelE/ParE family toxin [Desulfobacterales bacterium HSG17]
MRLKWSEDAIRDMDALRAYIEQDKPEAAKSVAKRILRGVEINLL